MRALGWKLVYGGRTPPPGAVVGPGERLSGPRMLGLGAQHVVAMFGATFVFPSLLGLNPSLAVMMSGVATIIFLLVVKGKVPSYLGASASFVASAGAIRAQGGDSAAVTGAILVTGVILLLIGVLVHFGGARHLRAVLPPAVTGAVVMIIGFSLATVATKTYFVADPWIGLLTVGLVLGFSALSRGFVGRMAILLALVSGYAISWVADKVSLLHHCANGKCVNVPRVDWSGVAHAPWVGLPHTITSPTFGPLTGPHLPTFKFAFILLVIPAVIALLAENAGHVKAVSEMTGDDLDPYLGRAYIGDGLGTTVASLVGSAPTTTYAENIGVMAATRIYSTLAYYIAAVVAIVVGFCPKFGALVAAAPSAVLGGVTLVLYGMIGLLGVKIWIENRVDFSNPINLMPLAAGSVAGVGNLTIGFANGFSLTGVTAGTLIVIVGYHAVRLITNRQDPTSAADPSLAADDGDSGSPPRATRPPVEEDGRAPDLLGRPGSSRLVDGHAPVPSQAAAPAAEDGEVR